MPTVSSLRAKFHYGLAPRVSSSPQRKKLTLVMNVTSLTQRIPYLRLPSPPLTGYADDEPQSERRSLPKKYRPLMRPAETSKARSRQRTPETGGPSQRRTTVRRTALVVEQSWTDG